MGEPVYTDLCRYARGVHSEFEHLDGSAIHHNDWFCDLLENGGELTRSVRQVIRAKDTRCPFADKATWATCPYNQVR